MNTETEIDIDGFGDLDIEDLQNEMKQKNPLDDIDSAIAEAEETGKSEVIIYKENCLKCSHLCVGIKDTVVETCTAENGNTRCPAQYIQISVGVDVNKIAAKIYEAKVNLDVDKLSRRMKRLDKLPKATIRRILDRVDQMSKL